jgi:hypothetical protein
MAKLTTVLGYSAAGLTLLVMAAAPVLLPTFTRAVAATGVQIDPAYGGGPVAHTIERGGWRIEVHQPVLPKAPLDRLGPFVQLAFRPLPALPTLIDEEVDYDGDGQADMRVRFELPADPAAKLYVDVTPLRPGVRALAHVEKESFAALIARLPDAVVVRVPLQRK